MSKHESLIGKTFNRLTIISKAKNNKHHCKQWLCMCNCGSITIVTETRLKNGHTKSCGCLQKEVIKKLFTIHGKSDTPEFWVWHNMLQRCINKNHPHYKSYGGRGITVCDQWKESFLNFINDMGNRPSKKHSIERNNNNLGYYPENCSWATRDTQSNNKRTNRLITYKGRTQSASLWARENGLKPTTVLSRICDYGWDEIKAITTPAKPWGR